MDELHIQIHLTQAPKNQGGPIEINQNSFKYIS